MLGIDKLLIKRVLAFAGRRGLSALGLLLIERGWVDANDWGQLSLALVPVLVDLGWSLYEKSKADKKLDTALEMPKDSTRADLAEKMAADKAA